MTTFSTPTDYAAVAALIKNDLQQIGINVNIVAQDTATFGAANGVGQLRLGPHRPRHARRRRRLRRRVPPVRRTVYQAWFKGYGGNKQMFRLIGNGRIHARHRRSGCRCTRR